MKQSRLFLVLLSLLVMTLASCFNVKEVPVVPASPEVEQVKPSTSEEVGAMEDLRQWVNMEYRDPAGRPLPVTGNWMCGLPRSRNPLKEPGHSPLGWDPNYFVELIKQGHHVIPTFYDTIDLANRVFLPLGWDTGEAGRKQWKDIMDARLREMRPALEFCRDNKLPIAFRGWNWLVYPAEFTRRHAAGMPIKPEDDLRILYDGKQDDKAAANNPAMDPCGPLQGWRDFGAFWMGNPMMQEIQKIYPDPPMVIFLDNNEAGKVSSQVLNEKADRFVAKYGKGPHDNEFKNKVIAEGYAERLAAMFEAARKACIAPAWGKNLRFVAYNNLEAPYDGGMPEFYDNDYQFDKTDYGPAGLQSDAMNMYAFQNMVFYKDPGFYWSTIIWDGEYMNNIWRSRGQGTASMAKPFQYASSGQRWDFNRYEGTFQFGLWVMRPKEFREFRGDEERNAYMDGAWQRTLAMVDRPWSNPVLKDFWRFGTLVPNRYEPATRPAGEKWDEQSKNLDRWFVLKCDANPPRGEWTPEEQLRTEPPPVKPADYKNGKDPWKDAQLRVFSIALMRGEKPKRSWLIYAHAPLGAVANCKIQLPGFGDVKLDSVPLSGSFFVVNETDRSVKTLIAGGPAEIAITGVQKYVSPGSEVTFNAQVTCPPPDPFTGFIWSWGEGKELRQDKLAPVTIPFAKEGDYLVTVTGTTKIGGTVVAQQEIFVGQKPDVTLLYDLPLSKMFEWQGPWGWTGKQGEQLMPYSQLPNAGSKGRAMVAGGKIVADPERGAVLEFSGEPQLKEAIWLTADKDTMMDKKGIPSRTISLWFKAVSTQPHQILYADGSYVRGSNIYLSEGKLYAGAWAAPEWPGSWISSGEVQPGKWYQVTLVIEGATEKVEDNKMRLFLDGTLVAQGPARMIPASYCPPRVGGTEYNAIMYPITLFHDAAGENSKFKGGNCQFIGRLSNFKLINRAVAP